jgi:hypothetical protein
MGELKNRPPQFLETVEELLRRGHAVRFQADGWSMHPTIRNGEVILVEPVGDRALRMGDVLLYRRSRSAIAHRLIRVRGLADGRRQLLLRGDAADSCDPLVHIDHVLGRVVAVERDGRTLPLGLLSRTWSPAYGWALRRYERFQFSSTKRRTGCPTK